MFVGEVDWLHKLFLVTICLYCTFGSGYVSCQKVLSVVFRSFSFFLDSTKIFPFPPIRNFCLRRFISSTTERWLSTTRIVIYSFPSFRPKRCRAILLAKVFLVRMYEEKRADCFGLFWSISVSVSKLFFINVRSKCGQKKGGGLQPRNQFLNMKWIQYCEKLNLSALVLCDVFLSSVLNDLFLFYI